jgi:ATP-dependent helicase/nuclease subunit A
MKFTNEQQKAIEERNKEILASAAAGSGKTAVLTERAVNLILRDGIDIDRLLILTFTEAAAGEMKRRIYDALAAARDSSANGERARRQLALLPSAAISTIHSFCASVIRKNFQLINIDPAFRIADKSEAALIKQDALDEILEEAYENGSEDFYLLAEWYAAKVKDDSLAEIILNVAESIEADPDPECFITRAYQNFDYSGDFFETDWGRYILNDAETTLRAVLENVRLAANLCEAPRGPEKYLTAIGSDFFAIEALLKNPRNAFRPIEFETLKRKSKNDGYDPELTDKVKEIRAEYKEELKKLSKTPTDAEDVKKCYPVMKVLAETVLKFRERFAQKKREKNVCDFNDLERFCLEITKKIPLDYAEALIDEYQDVSLKQEKILSAVAGSRFMAGDVKQSIYRFRNARPDLFAEKYEKAAVSRELTKIDLSKNFRSRASVIDIVNKIFGKIMTREMGGVDYNEDCALRVGAVFQTPDSRLLAPELIIADPGEPSLGRPRARFETEAEAIAEKILELSNDFKFSDMAVLARSLSGGAAEIITETLKKRDIPVYADVAGAFWESLEIQTALAFLQIVDNPKQDIPLLCALKSFSYRFGAEELAEIRGADDTQKTFYDALIKTDNPKNPKIKKFLNDLNKWRDLSNSPVSELIQIIYDDSNYYNFAGAAPGGGVRQANLRGLLAVAEAYEKTGYKSLFNFTRYAEKIKSLESRGATVAEAENAVLLTTVHKSKGLEFPVVFVSLLGKNFNRDDARKKLLMDAELGFGPNLIDIENRTRKQTAARAAVAKKILRENMSEELRILYVALTRAKEKLILTGTAKNLKTGEKITALNIMRANSFLDIVAPASEIEPQFFSEESPETVLPLKKSLKEIDREKDYGKKNEIQKRFAFVYKNNIEKTLPAKLSVSEIKRNFYELEISDGEELTPQDDFLSFAPPDFISQKSPGTARGKATHAVLEKIDFFNCDSPKKIKAFIESLTGKFFTPDEAKLIPVYQINNFINSRLCERIRRAERVWREEPFVMEISPFEAYGLEEYKNVRDKILVHGIIDCYFEEDGLILLDYKSDFAPPGATADELAKKYKIQMDIYKKALERATGKKVAESIVYFLSLNDYAVLRF